MKEEIRKLLEETFKQHVPGDAPQDVADLTRLLADATAAYVFAVASPTLDPAVIQKEYIAQTKVGMENLRFDALNMRLGPEEVVALISKIIPLVMAV